MVGVYMGLGQVRTIFRVPPKSIRVTPNMGKVPKWKELTLVAGKQGPRSSTTIGAPVPVLGDFAVTWQGVSKPLIGDKKKEVFFLFKFEFMNC